MAPSRHESLGDHWRNAHPPRAATRAILTLAAGGERSPLASVVQLDLGLATVGMYYLALPEGQSQMTDEILSCYTFIANQFRIFT